MEARAEKVWRDVGLEGPSMDGGGAGDGDEESQEPRGRIWEGVWWGRVLGGEANGRLGLAGGRTRRN